MFAPSFPAEVRASSSQRGTLALLQAFDPVRRRAFDYARIARLSPAGWLSRAVLRFDWRPGSEIGGQGRVTDALMLPPGRYEVRVWFEGGRARPGSLEAIVPGGYVLADVEGPLSNPSVMLLDLPVAAPVVWVRLSDKESVQGARRVEVAPLEVYYDSTEARVDARAVEPLAGRPGAYLAYVDDNTFPENGVFWTRGTARGSVLVVPAGATSLELVLHVGPADTRVLLSVGDDERQALSLRADETRRIRLSIPAGIRAIPVAVEADASFVPARVDASSTDTRRLGCQVRVLVD
jgi:hypothetical protein